MADNIDRELDWDEGIELNPSSFTILPEGEYEFKVTKFERQRHPGSAKLPSCPKAVLTLEVPGPDGASAVITHNLFLHTKTKGLLSAFFISIGQGKQGETVRLDWSKVVGSTGRASIGIRKYEKKDGSTGEANEIKQFLPPLRNWTAGGF
jgi:hypothetical protein